MKVIIFGGRYIRKYEYVVQAVHEAKLAEEIIDIDEIVSGGAPGVDQLAEEYANNNAIDLTIMHANWVRRGKAAGPHRNERMERYGDAGIAIWDGVSRGTKDMITRLRQAGKPVFIKIVTDHKRV